LFRPHWLSDRIGKRLARFTGKLLLERELKSEQLGTKKKTVA